MKVKKVCALLGAVIALASVGGCSAMPKNQYNPKTVKIETNEENKKIFAPQEHIMSKPISHLGNPTKENIQYEYIEGYDFVGIGRDVIGDNDVSNCAMYVNEVSVECVSTGLDEDYLFVYTSNGMPLEYSSEVIEHPDIKVFQPKQHIISIPFYMPTNPGEDNYQYPYLEGYVPVYFGAPASSVGLSDYYYQSYIVYKNVCPVECKITRKDENGKAYYLNPGTPVEKEAVRTLDNK